ncbi:Hsp70 family protein [Dokdonia ponticola]|uniref:Hsp70 family protein n=1 Tax=Dokdonia ponticola TaxID=2041041 RepID=A0ABV9HXG5_9FLAO
MRTINFAIDLGTTNSLIAKASEDGVKLYNNPIGLKQTLPSCIAFRGGRTVVGDKALDYLEKDAENVCMLFKRKMGSQETYTIPSLQKEKSPIDLSAIILTELKNFVGEAIIDSVVITIPASFDTIQSNATKKAGYLAGFKEVVLLQEPIAACLAFANTIGFEGTEEKKWIVYDLGGGTFDVALVSVTDREIKVLDNVGDNFLGGADFDSLIVEKIMIPFIEEKIGVQGLWSRIKQKGTNKGVYFELLGKAEEAKKELSLHESTEVEIDMEIEGVLVTEYLEITRGSFETNITPKTDRTIQFIKDVISNNQLLKTDIDRLVLIGGSTYVPLIKNKIKQEIGVLVDASINPTAAVVEGAAYYAGSKPSKLEMEDVEEDLQERIKDDIHCAFFYEQNTRDLEELISCKIEIGHAPKYRLLRLDGGYDSGIKSINTDGFAEFVPLLPKATNRFKMQLLDASNQVLKSYDTITINQGNYNVQGQPLPNDICMEVDDLDASSTRLEEIFKKGSVLPLKKKLYKTASKTILRQSKTSLVINIIEGKSNGLPSSGLSIGFIEISGEHLEEDLIKGTDIEIDVEISESRDVKISVYLQACDQEFENVFSESERAISIKKINTEVNTILNDLETLIKEANQSEHFEFSGQLEKIRIGLLEIQIESMLIEEGDVSDKKYQLDDAKRHLIYEFDALTRNKAIAKEIEDYQDVKESVAYQLEQNNQENLRKKYDRIVENEKAVINSGNKFLIHAKIKEFNELYNLIIHTNDENFIPYFMSLKYASGYTDTKKADRLIKDGEKALDKQDYKSLRYIVYGLSALLPDEDRDKRQQFNDDSKTGLK